MVRGIIHRAMNNRSLLLLLGLYLLWSFLDQAQGQPLLPLFELKFTIFAAFLLSITLHEYGHAAMATRAGDPTPRRLGRLSLNPLAHLDPIGTVAILVVNFGWARPVPIDPRNFRNPERDSVLVALAGPGMNLLLAAVSILAFRGLAAATLEPWTPMEALHFSQRMGLYFFIWMAVLNVLLAVFNLIPIRPLDGSHVLLAWLPPRQKLEYLRISPTLSIIALVLLFSHAFDPFFGFFQHLTFVLLGIAV